MALFIFSMMRRSAGVLLGFLDDADHVVPVQLDRLIQNAVRGVLSSWPGK